MNEALQPLLQLLGGKAGWLTTIPIWLGVLAPLTATFGGMFKRWISDKMNAIAASSDQDDDEYLREIFGCKSWRIFAFLARFTPFQLPTLADLERAIKLQKEAAIDAGGNLRTGGASVPASRNPILPILLGFSLLLAPCFLTGCAGWRPVPVADGQDAVVVNAERVQVTSLEYFKQVTEWELANRALLPREISLAVDQVRQEFPPLWRASRNALSDYKAKRGVSLDAMNRVTAALSAAQASLLQLRANDTDAITSISRALNQLMISVQQLRS